METFAGLDYFINTHQRVFWLYLLSALLLAAGVALYRGDRMGSYFSGQIWWHSSARLDYVYFVVISLIKVLVIVPLILSSKEVALSVALGLQATFGYHAPLAWSREAIMVLFTATLFVFSDLTRYWLHRLMHTVPLLWRFHRVHHSAEVLNPLTFYRVHPVENVLFGLRYALSAGAVTGLFIYLFGARIGLVEIIGVNAFVFAFALLGANLRHTHVPLRFGDRIERWIVSPYMHQYHHSTGGTRCNYGGALAVWDRWFRTLHIGPARPLAFGTEVRAHRSIAALLFEPFGLKFTIKKGFRI